MAILVSLFVINPFLRMCIVLLERINVLECGQKILVIDDELLNIKLLKTYLQAESYQVLNAQSGTKGLEIAIQQTPDLILLDIMMQDMDGYEVARKIERPTTDTAYSYHHGDVFV